MLYPTVLQPYSIPPRLSARGKTTSILKKSTPDLKKTRESLIFLYLNYIYGAAPKQHAFPSPTAPPRYHRPPPLATSLRSGTVVSYMYMK